MHFPQIVSVQSLLTMCPCHSDLSLSGIIGITCVEDHLFICLYGQWRTDIAHKLKDTAETWVTLLSSKLSDVYYPINVLSMCSAFRAVGFFLFSNKESWSWKECLHARWKERKRGSETEIKSRERKREREGRKGDRQRQRRREREGERETMA